MTTTPDKTLLELAAKAAGIKLKPMQINNVTKQGDDRFIGYLTESKQWRRGWFDPLTDDGDALRLAVKLDLAVMPYPVFESPKHSVVVSQRNLEHSRFEVVELHETDPYAATRRAIVRAAAMIGESL